MVGAQSCSQLHHYWEDENYVSNNDPIFRTCQQQPLFFEDNKNTFGTLGTQGTEQKNKNTNDLKIQ